MKVKGYGGTVEEWAGEYAKQGVVYVSLNSYSVQMTVLPEKAAGGYVNAPLTASVGDTIKITPKPNEGYQLLSILCGDRPMDENNSITVRAEDVKNDQITITIVYVKSVKAGEFELDVEDKSLNFQGAGATLFFPHTWMSTKLVITRQNKRVGNWAWNFKSSAPDYVSVDSEGNLRALKETGTGVTITATWKENSSVKLTFTAKVDSEVKMKEITGFAFDEDVYGFDGCSGAE